MPSLFQLEKDAENYTYQKLMGGKIRLKAHIVPHKFDCQGRSVQNSVACLNRTVLKRKRVLAEVLHNHPGASEYNERGKWIRFAFVSSLVISFITKKMKTILLLLPAHVNKICSQCQYTVETFTFQCSSLVG